MKTTSKVNLPPTRTPALPDTQPQDAPQCFVFDENTVNCHVSPPRSVLDEKGEEQLPVCYTRLTMIRGVICIILSITFAAMVEGKPHSVDFSPPATILSLTGGSTDPPPKKKKKKRTKRTEKEVAEEKKVIQEAMREKDAATALGDAIR